MTHRHFLFMQCSARDGGNSAQLARVAAAALSASDTQDWRNLETTPLQAFQDLRHSGGYAAPTGVAAELLQATLAATDIVIVAPLYWYSLPAAAKLYLDHWSHWMRVPELHFKTAMEGKRLWLIMAHASSAPDEIAPAITSLRLSALYMNMAWAGALLGDANAPGQIQEDTGALQRAEHFFLT